MKNLVIVRGGGDIATGTIHKLVRCGFSVLILEIDKPTAIRRNVSFCEAMYEGEVVIDGVCCKKVKKIEELFAVLEKRQVAIMEDPDASVLEQIEPIAVVDAILAKKNLGTTKEMSSITIALGPGFFASKDVDIVIETQRGHQLGRIIRTGYAIENTGIPGTIAGVSKKRVMYSPVSGEIKNLVSIGDLVTEGMPIATINGDTINASITGILRGIIRDGFDVKVGLKIADIDPRTEELSNSNMISDKARCIAGGVLEALFMLRKEQGNDLF